MVSFAIDEGNTRIKLGVFEGTSLKEVQVDFSWELWPETRQKWHPNKAIWSSVRSDAVPDELQMGEDLILLDHSVPTPISNHYDTPHTLGMDRLAAVVGANSLYPQENTLVIDAGTTITYDLIDSTGSYIGGGISPGIDIRFQSLHQYTKKLPLIGGKPHQTPLIGSNTENSLKSGVLNGVVAETEGIIRRYAHKFPNLKVLLCGGDADFFESSVKAPIFVVPHLVLIGLNSILLHNAKRNL